jgi:hypothetical protein
MLLASQTTLAGIRDRASPALYEADLARAAYEQLDANLRSKECKKVVFLKESDRLWDAMGGPAMMRVFFPSIGVECCDCNDAAESRGPRTSATTVVVRLGMNGRLAVVR